MGRLLLILALAATQAAPSIKPGGLVDGIACASDPSQTYALYLPSTYTPDRQWPLLVVFDPRGRGAQAAAIFQEAAERLGWIVAGSNNTRSDGPWEPNRRAVAAMLPDLFGRLPVDTARVYAAGFSGGGGVAWALARESGQLAGIITVGMPEPGKESGTPRVAWFGAAGRHDFNFLDAKATYARMTGVPRRVEFFDGGHQWFPSAMAARALDWFEGLAAGAADSGAEGSLPPPSRDEERAEQGERQRRGEIGRALMQLYETDLPLLPELRGALKIATLQRQAVGSGAAADAAQRSLELIFVQTSVYLPADLESKKRFAAAARALEVAASTHPDRAHVWHDLAAAQAMSGSRREALRSLERAVDLGLTGRAAVERDTRFDPIRADPAFAALLARIPA